MALNTILGEVLEGDEEREETPKHFFCDGMRKHFCPFRQVVWERVNHRNGNQ